MRNAFMETIIQACTVRDDIFILSGDAGLGVFDRFKEDHPQRFRNMGVAEQNTVSFAAGLAMTGFKVLVYNIAPFVLYRCYEQVRNDICYQELPVILVGTGSGITYAPMGMSHYAIEDVGIARTLPNLETISPADPVEARMAALYALESANPLYVRLAKRGEPVFHESESFDIARPAILRDGTDTAILFHGSISVEVVKAWELLYAAGRAPRVISLAMLQPLDTNSLLLLLEDIHHVVTVEEHYAECGLGSIISHIKVNHSVKWTLNCMGVPYRFIHKVSDCTELRHESGISASDILVSVESLAGGAA